MEESEGATFWKGLSLALPHPKSPIKQRIPAIEFFSAYLPCPRGYLTTVILSYVMEYPGQYNRGSASRTVAGMGFLLALAL